MNVAGLAASHNHFWWKIHPLELTPQHQDLAFGNNQTYEHKYSIKYRNYYNYLETGI